jgi:uncharacterized protein (TIGR02453 family)
MNVLNPDTFSFLTGIQENNNKIWFEANKPRYIDVRKQFIDFISELIVNIAKIEKIPVQDPAKNVFRIYRDVRFSKNKDPYKNNMGGWISRGESPRTASFYIHLQPGESFIGGGMYDPTPEELKAIRREIHFQGDALQKIVDSKTFKSEFGGIFVEDKLKKAPQGFQTDHPHIELLKFKHYVVGKPVSEEDMLSEKFMDTCLKTYANSLDFFRFLDNAILNKE